jgi:hypothetical protein
MALPVAPKRRRADHAGFRDRPRALTVDDRRETALWPIVKVPDRAPSAAISIGDDGSEENADVTSVGAALTHVPSPRKSRLPCPGLLHTWLYRIG